MGGYNAFYPRAVTVFIVIGVILTTGESPGGVIRCLYVQAVAGYEAGGLIRIIFAHYLRRDDARFQRVYYAHPSGVAQSSGGGWYRGGGGSQCFQPRDAVSC